MDTYSLGFFYPEDRLFYANPLPHNIPSPSEGSIQLLHRKTAMGRVRGLPCNGSINYLTDSSIINLIQQTKENVDHFIDELIATGLIYKKGSEIRFLTDQCEIIALPDGRFAAGENKSGELSYWLNKYWEGRKQNKDWQADD